MRKQGGEPLCVRVSIPSNRKPLLSLLLHIHTGGQAGPRNIILRGIHYGAHLQFHPVRCPKRRLRWGCEEVGAPRRMLVTTKARCPGRTHLKTWPRETGMLIWSTRGPVSTNTPELFFSIRCEFGDIWAAGRARCATVDRFHVRSYLSDQLFTGFSTKVHHLPIGQRCVKVASEMPPTSYTVVRAHIRERMCARKEAWHPAAHYSGWRGGWQSL